MRRPVETGAMRTTGARPAPAGRSALQTPRERKPREERWPELVAVATDVFYERGYEGASLRDIADRLGMLKGSLYYYIHNKDDLLFEAIKAVYEPGLEIVRRAAEQPGDPLERLEQVLVAHIEYTCEHLVGTAVYLHELSSLPAPLRRKVDGRPFRRLLEDLLEQADAAGMLRPDVDIKLAVAWMLGATNWVYRWFRPAGQLRSSQIAPHFADLTIHGIATTRALTRRARRKGARSTPASAKQSSPT